MKSITIKPKDGERYEIGYQGDHNVNKLVFDVESEGDLYLKLQLKETEYEPIPIPDKEFPITSTYTKEQCTYDAQILEKDELGDYRKNSPIFKLSLKKSIEETDNVKEVVPPNFKNAYDSMVEITNQIKEAFKNGDFNGNGIVSIEKESTSGLTDTYKIIFSDGKETKFNVTNGKGIVSIEKTNTQENIDTYTITFNDETTSTFTLTNGIDGKSAYELAVKNGFEGTEKEWLESLRYDHSEEFKQLADQVKQDVNNAVDSAMNEANTTAQANVEAINKASTDAQNAITTAKDNAVQAVQDAQSTAEEAVGTKQTEAVQSVDTAKTSATTEINEQKEGAVSAITQEKNSATEAIETGKTDALTDIATDRTGALNDIETAKNDAIEEIENTGVPLEDVEKLAIKETAQGNPTIINDSAEWRLQNLNVYGQSGQDGTPTPENPVEIISKEVSEIKVTGVNILKLENIEEATRDGITYSVENGLIKVKGTAERDYFIQFHVNNNHIALLAGQTYIFNPNPIKGTETLKMYLDFTNGNTLGFSIASNNVNISKTLNKKETDYTYVLRFIYKTGQTVDMEYKPQVLMSNVLLPYEPYKDQTITLTEPITLRGIPVSSGGNVTIDEQQYVADYIDSLTGKVNRLNGYIDSYNGEEVGTIFMSTTGQLTTGAKVIYNLSQPIQENLPQQSQEAIMALTTYYPNTVIDCGAYNKVNYIADTKMYIDKQVAALSEAMLER